MRKLVLTLTLAAASMGVAIAAPYTPTGPNHSGGTTLNQLVSDGGYLKIGDKIFDNFRWAEVTNSCPTLNCDVADPGPLKVEVGKDSRGNYALLFGGVLGLVQNNDTNPLGQKLDYHLFYQVHTTDGRALITGITQKFGGMNIDTGTIGFAEDASDLVSGDLLGHSQLNWTTNKHDATDPPGEIGSDILTFDPVSDLQVFKDLTFTAKPDGWAYVSSFTQGFAQVPEPGFYGVLAIGLSGLMFLKRRKQAE